MSYCLLFRDWTRGGDSSPRSWSWSLALTLGRTSLWPHFAVNAGAPPLLAPPPFPVLSTAPFPLHFPQSAKELTGHFLIQAHSTTELAKPCPPDHLTRLGNTCLPTLGGGCSAARLLSPIELPQAQVLALPPGSLDCPHRFLPRLVSNQASPGSTDWTPSAAASHRLSNLSPSVHFLSQLNHASSFCSLNCPGHSLFRSLDLEGYLTDKIHTSGLPRAPF